MTAFLAEAEAQREKAAETPRRRIDRPYLTHPLRRGRKQTETTKQRISESMRQYHSRKLAPGEIRAARIAKELTQAQAARLAGLSLAHYRDVEAGRSERVDSLGRIRHVLEIDCA